HDPRGPKPNEIVLLAASDGKGHNGGIDNILADVTPNRQEYADLHGYHYLFINITKYNIGNARPVWAKLPAIVEAFNLFPEAKWVWWLDLDAIIMTPTVELTAHILAQDVLREKMKKGVEMNKSGGGRSGIITSKNPDMGNIDIIVAQDQNGLNAGSFFIRRSEFSRILIDMWSEPLFIRENWNGQEQDALWHLVKEHPTVLEHLALVSQRQINAYPVNNVADMSWESGDLVVHIAGCWVKNECNDQWKKFMGRR
ncbi:galactosyl transferase, partial [Wilcoxina mikolae CBS 423.85]